ncbi:coiled-coil domain-containing protein [Streptomyces gobiensis]|uniref:coiled-coil domain-containing protein n=1 Tax=Streptomyces gobiensis TaxID=2875706 RepID=UPI001E2C0822|nr:hypothetical protein [Streptomyces gobiensis]UGY92217.1 hypothetical protein test1122_11070 [Streptomyces gobiensis]
MPRGRHRHSPPLHRLLAPSAIAAVALACAGSAWLVGGGLGQADALVLRGLSGGAAVAAVTGAVLMRRWDRAAGRRVGAVRAAKARLEWRLEERQAELETDLEESEEMRGKLEDKLRERREELNQLRTEHAALLRRYAHAETERASALEGRRQLAIAAGEPAKELTAEATDHRAASGAPTSLTYRQADEALRNLRRNAARQREREQEQEQEPEREPEPGQEPGPEHGETAAPEGPEGGFSFFGSQPRLPQPPKEPAPVKAAPVKAEPAKPAAPEVPRQPARPRPNAAGKVIDLAG